MWRWFWLCLLGVFAGCSAPRDTVVVYSPHGPEVLGDYEVRFETAHPDVDVQVLDMGAQDVYARVKAESARPQGDVWWGAPTSMFIQAAGEGLLEPYRPTWASQVDADCRDPEDRWYATFRSPLAILFNNTVYTRETAPQTWDELIEPKWKGKITLRKPLPSGTMRIFIGAMIMRQPSVEAGLEWLRKLNANTESYEDSPQFLFDHIKRRGDLVTVWLEPDTVLQRERNRYPFDCVVPPDTPALLEGIAVIKGAPHADWARKFYEFVTSPESLAQQAHAYAKMPVRNDIDPATLPAWMSSLHYTPMKIDWKTFAEHENEWCERWTKEVYQAP